MSYPLQVLAQTGLSIYCVVRGVVSGARRVWNPTLNTGAGGWEAFNGANWAQYAIALTEDGASGYYAANYPANIAGVLTSESFYADSGTPTLGDAPIAPIAQTQGQNVAAVGGDADVAATFQQALVFEVRGAAAGTPTASVIPTNLTSALTNVYAGRSVLFTSGDASGCGGRIVAYDPSNGALTLAAPLADAPAAADTFVIV